LGSASSCSKDKAEKRQVLESISGIVDTSKVALPLDEACVSKKLVKSLE
jgi:hypothetical protein